VSFQTYATYIRGLDWEGPIPGLLTLADDALRFESFEKKSPLAALLPEGWRPKQAPVEVSIPRSEIRRITDLDGRTSEKRGLARVMTWLNLEPNGVRVEWGERVVIFDCERPIDALLNE
jgi:hypothetical protein